MLNSNIKLLFDDVDGVAIKPSVPSLQYWAGLFDGEGHVTISNQGRVSIGITQKKSEILHIAVDEFGGRVCDKGGCDVWKIAASRDVLSFLEDIRPYTRIKSDEIDIAVNCAKLARPDNLGCNPLTEAEKQERMDLRNELQALRPKKTFRLSPSMEAQYRTRIKEKFDYRCSMCNCDVNELPVQAQIIKNDTLYCRSCHPKTRDPAIKHITKEQIIEAMDSTSNLDDACAKLGINRSSLYMKRKKFGLPMLSLNNF